MSTSDNPATSEKVHDVALSEDDLQELVARAAHATPGPWRLVTHYDSGANVATVRSSDRRLCVEAGPCVFCRVEGERVSPYENDLANAEFIAHAREDVRRLVREVTRLRAEAESHRETIKTAIPALVMARVALARTCHLVIGEVEAACQKLGIK